VYYCNCPCSEHSSVRVFLVLQLQLVGFHFSLCFLLFSLFLFYPPPWPPFPRSRRPFFSLFVTQDDQLQSYLTALSAFFLVSLFLSLFARCQTLIQHNYNLRIRCWEGYEEANSLTCTMCNKGRYRGNLGGIHRVDVANSECVVCTGGKYSNQEGLSKCDDCGIGMYSTGTCTFSDPDGGPKGGCQSCKNCPQGQYQDTTGSTSW
jgi:hypothetical protein